MTHLAALLTITKTTKMMSSTINFSPTCKYVSSYEILNEKGNKESNQHPRQNGSNEAENLETKHGEMNTIPEAKSDLDVSDMVAYKLNF
jgi:hypothetical protein